MNWDDWRLRINELDNQILQLLTQRAEAALRIGDLKRRQEAPIYVPEREAEILRRLAAANPGPLPAEAVVAIWREILSGCRALEARLTVAYLGPQATFTHQAARERFGASVDYRAARSIGEVFDDVERGRADFGVVPVENSTEGAVNVTLDRLTISDVVIAGELRLEIAQQLLSRAADLGEIKRVLSHPQGLAQCRGWLAEHLPEVPTEEVLSTAAAAELAAADPMIAAIASELAGQLYAVPALRARIEDNPHNATRFLVIGRRPVGPTGRDKTTILFAMRNEPGSLHRILEPIAGAGLNLTKIESRPAKQGPWEYVIFVDLEGHRETPAVAAVLDEIGKRTLHLKILGSYPAA
ncbi:MAG: prephenate dehydratase [Candidatus Rokubacteria bacterium]|nr:prephenate dehydratase [Candidatus Rokubacteria bacterium]MBI2490554.1 prephenate dehydratase [Candidatus Rokubacteria bacterium]MBI4253505.1 prephenate dehydratase [Candidatus Rokubacteria bacterium]MBI4628899.1 prephenate dehydratase [Candidatus Rokubacteria bacterium]